MSSTKTLLVRYLPRGDRSHTGELVREFRAATAGAAIEDLDLAAHPPQPFSAASVGAYIARNYLGETLSPNLQAAIAGADRLTAQLKAADIVALATPMYNFSLPAAVKAWFDAVMLKGETWDIDASGYVGLLTGRKALILMASGGAYEGPMAGWDHAMSLAKQEFRFMGFSDIRHAWAAGVNNPAVGAPEAIVAAAKADVRAAATAWYGG